MQETWVYKLKYILHEQQYSEKRTTTVILTLNLICVKDWCFTDGCSNCSIRGPPSSGSYHSSFYRLTLVICILLWYPNSGHDIFIILTIRFSHRIAASSCKILEKAMAPYSNTLAWKIPWSEDPGRLQSIGSLEVGHDWATSLSIFTFMHGRREWQPTPVFLPGESQGRGSLWAAVYGVAQSRTRLKRLSSNSSRTLRKML